MKYTPGLLVGRLSRSAGNTTASHNRYGAYLRNRVIPVNPSSSKQRAQRAALASFSAQYKTLTATQQAAWVALGASFVRSDSLGNSYNLTGLQAFESVNLNLSKIGVAPITAAPAYTPPTTVYTLTPTATH